MSIKHEQLFYALENVTSNVSITRRLVSNFLAQNRWKNTQTSTTTIDINTRCERCGNKWDCSTTTRVTGCKNVARKLEQLSRNGSPSKGSKANSLMEFFKKQEKFQLRRTCGFCHYKHKLYKAKLQVKKAATIMDDPEPGQKPMKKKKKRKNDFAGLNPAAVVKNDKDQSLKKNTAKKSDLKNSNRKKNSNKSQVKKAHLVVSNKDINTSLNKGVNTKAKKLQLKNNFKHVQKRLKLQGDTQKKPKSLLHSFMTTIP